MAQGKDRAMQQHVLSKNDLKSNDWYCNWSKLKLNFIWVLLSRFVVIAIFIVTITVTFPAGIITGLQHHHHHHSLVTFPADIVTG